MPNNAVIPGDPYGPIKDPVPGKEPGIPSAKEVNKLHTNADTDATTLASHHTVGIKRNQAASGAHTHNGNNSIKIGEGDGRSISGSKGGNAALASLITLLSNYIDFTDNTT